MKDRIAHIMRAKNLKASDFAALLGIQPSGVSHILAGRNKPSLEFVKKIKEVFPEYNLDWIIFGTGPITTSEPFNNSPTSTQNPVPRIEDTIPFDFETEADIDTDPLSDSLSLSDQNQLSKPNVNNNAVKSMLVLYEDGTFETYLPR